MILDVLPPYFVSEKLQCEWMEGIFSKICTSCDMEDFGAPEGDAAEVLIKDWRWFKYL